MRIVKVRLRNVKSYGEDASEVEFANGTNFLSGPNGAGKSTLIEAIGYVLFGVLPYTRDDFVRRDAKHGVATAWIEDSGETFRVERKCGSINSWVVYDKDDVGIHDRADDVLKFLCERFHVVDASQLANVFQNIVGVQQGMFTTVFKMTPANRKKIFDGIINVNLYRDATEKRGGVKNKMVTEDIHDLEKKVEASHAYITEHREDPKKLADAESRLKIAVDQVSELSTGRDALKKTKKAFEITKAKLDALDLKLAGLEARIIEGQKALERARTEVARSKHASEVCVRSGPGHRSYLAAEKQLGVLEKRRTQRDSLQKRAHTLEKQIKTEEMAIEGLEGELIRGREKEKKRAEEARDLEGSWKVKDVAALAGENDAERAQGAYDKQADAFDVARQGERNYLGRLDKARAAADQVGECLEQASNLEKALAPYAEVAKLAATAGSARKSENAVSRKLTKAETEIEEQESNKKQLASLICPFIKEECDRVKPAVFQAKITAFRTLIQALETELKAARKTAKDAANAEKRLEGLREKKDQLSELRRSLRREWGKARKQLSEWKPFWGKYPDFPQGDDGKLDLSAFERYAKELEAELNRRDRELKAQAKSAKDAAAEAKGKRKTADAARQAHVKEVKEWDDLRDDLAKRNAALEIRKQQLSKAVGRKGPIARELESFSSLEKELSQTRALRETHRSAHQEFVHNDTAAGELKMREEAVVSTEAAIHETKRQRMEAQSERAKVAETYDAAEAAKVSQDFEQAVAQLGSAEAEKKGQEALRSDLDKSVKRLAAESASVERWTREKARLQRFAQLLADVWEILRALGPRVSARLLSGISARANRIFGLLHDQPGHLVWGRDYEVRLRQGGGEYSFANLSGGEQMSAALAIQMAMARDFAGSSFCIFDEPTVHMDESRRQRLAIAIRDAQVDAGFTQVFIVSHDDTFGPYVDHQVKLQKTPTEGTRVLL